MRFGFYQYMTVLSIMSYFLTFGNCASAGTPPSFQCALLKVELGEKPKRICSGTFLDNRLFLTASHCFKNSDFGLGPYATGNYFVQCLSGITVPVLSILAHPYARTSMIGDDGGSMAKLTTSDLSVTSYNDVAIVLTKPTQLIQFPKLPTKRRLSTEYATNSCSTLGFAPFYCSEAGEGCFRNGFSIILPEPKKSLLEQCNFATGKGCLVSRVFNETSSTPQPLMLKITKLGMMAPELTKGDSGAGILCATESGQEELAAVFVADMGAAINVVNKIEFIQHFLSLSTTEIIKEIENYSFSEKLKRVMVLTEKIDQVLKKYSEAENSEYILVKPAGIQYFNALSALNALIIKDPSDFSRLLKRRNIRAIEPSINPKKTWGWYLRSKNVVVDGDSFRTLIYNEAATFNDFAEILTSN